MRQLVFAMLFAYVAAPAAAQDTGTRAPVDHKQTISTSPIADILGFINAEYQRKVTDAATFGVSAGTIDFDDDDYTNVMLFGRYYPQGAALTGFFMGGRIGMHRIAYDTYDYVPPPPGSFPGPPIVRRKSESRPAFGVDVGYDWLLGAKRNVHIGVGAGGMRIFGDNDDNYTVAFPTARLNVGFAF
ncbi:MAG TPA: DUF3575 domain-containing protein [Vicinamibacterales bacterium]